MTDDNIFQKLNISQNVNAPHLESPDGELSPIVNVTDHLTERESQVLYMVRTLQYETRTSPKLRDIAKIFGLGESRIKRIISNLVGKGYLEWSKGKDWRHKSILFPRGMKFPWSDTAQFPSDIFSPR